MHNPLRYVCAKAHFKLQGKIRLKKIRRIVDNMSSSDLYATQKKISGRRIQKNYELLRCGELPPDIKVYGNLIIDGHHRYVSGKIFGKLPNKVPWSASSATTKVDWKNVIVEDLFW